MSIIPLPVKMATHLSAVQPQDFESYGAILRLRHLFLVIFICTKVKKGLILVKGKLNRVANVRARLILCGTICVLFLTLTI